MDPNLDYRNALKKQIEVNCIDLVYTYKVHVKMVDILDKESKILSRIQIVLSGIVTFLTFLPFIVTSNVIITASGLLVSVILLVTTSILDKSVSIERRTLHYNIHTRCWSIKEEYMSLLTDFDALSTDVIKNRRDELLEETGIVLSVAPKTSEEAYKKARKAIQADKEQAISEKDRKSILR